MPQRLQVIMAELLSYLTVAALSVREELVLKMAVLAERYASEHRWYVDVMLALIATIHFTLATEVHQLSHPQASTASSACGHEGCATEKTPAKEPDSSSSSDCQTCEALASAHSDLLHVQILLSRPIHGALQVPSDATLIDFQVKKGRPGRSPPCA